MRETTRAAAWFVITMLPILMFAAITYVALLPSESNRSRCTEAHGVCIETTDGWKPWHRDGER